jgi:hypothetical protein
MGGDSDVNDAAAIVGQHHQDEQETVRRGRDHEQIGCHELSHVIRQERAPCLRGWLPMADHVFRDGGLTHVNPEFQQFPVRRDSSPARGPAGARRRSQVTDQSVLRSNAPPAVPQV